MDDNCTHERRGERIVKFSRKVEPEAGMAGLNATAKFHACPVRPVPRPPPVLPSPWPAPPAHPARSPRSLFIGHGGEELEHPLGAAEVADAIFVGPHHLGRRAAAAASTNLGCARKGGGEGRPIVLSILVSRM